jgi:hypothetical protein
MTASGRQFDGFDPGLAPGIKPQMLTDTSGRRVWDSNPREHSRALTVFKTVALGH